MKNSFYCNKAYFNIYKYPSNKSEIVSQILYGEKFNVLKKKKNYLKIKSVFDKYTGFIKKSNFKKISKNTHKIKVLRSRIYLNPINKRINKTKKFLFFSSEIEILKKENNFIMFENKKWISKEDIESKTKINKNFIKILKKFLGIKYKWGGRTFDGIDCSALVQIIYKYNNKFFPRDTIDQIKFKKGSILKRKFKKGNLIYWKGHVAICLNSKYLIHAYGPKKKVVIMPIKKTIKLIEKTANLKIKKVFSI